MFVIDHYPYNLGEKKLYKFYIALLFCLIPYPEVLNAHCSFGHVDTCKSKQVNM